MDRPFLDRQLLDPVHRTAAAASAPAAAEPPGSTRSSSGGRSPRRCPPTPRSTRSSRAVEDAGVAAGRAQLLRRRHGRPATAGCCPARPARAEFRDNIDVAVGIGERLGRTAFNALYGNRVDGVAPREAGRARRREPGAGRAGGGRGSVRAVLVEPVSGAPRYPLRTAADAVAVIDRVRPTRRGQPRDCSPTSTTSPSTATTSTPRSPTTPAGSAHVQIADAPGRGEPGTGELAARAPSSAASHAAGYRGWVGLEYKARAGHADQSRLAARARRGRTPTANGGADP